MNYLIKLMMGILAHVRKHYYTGIKMKASGVRINKLPNMATPKQNFFV
jgi:hypothetical protein